MTPLQMVRQFHEAFGVPAYDTPRIPDKARRKLRRKLIREEYRELMRALRKNDLIGIADGGADLSVVVNGTMLEYGIDLDAVLEEVHASNMAKLAADGKPILREDGKVLKPAGWKGPDIQKILERQVFLAESKNYLQAQVAGWRSKEGG